MSARWTPPLVAALVLAGVSGAFAAILGDAQPRLVRYSTQTMGTWGSVTLVTADSSASAGLAGAALDELHDVDARMSNWRDSSELSRMNRGAAAGPVRIGSELMEVLDEAMQISRDSDGAFDITVEPLVRLWGFLDGTPHVPPAAAIDSLERRVGWRRVELDPRAQTVRFADPTVRVDLGGIAKGYGVDQAAAALRRAGVRQALVDLSGNMVALGAPPGRTAWKVGLRDPEDRVPYFAVFHLRDRALATSGDYEQFVDEGGKRYGHILDPRSGWPAHGFSSVTVVAPTAMQADGWATALFVLGPGRARAVAARHPELELILVEPQENARTLVWVEKGLAGDLHLVEGQEARFELRVFGNTDRGD